MKFKIHWKIILKISLIYILILVILNIISAFSQSSENIYLITFFLSTIGIISYCIGLVILLKKTGKGIIKSYILSLQYFFLTIILLAMYEFIDYILTLFVYIQKFFIGWVTLFGFIFSLFVPLFFIKNIKARVVVLVILGLLVSSLVFHIAYNWNKPVTPYCEEDFLKIYEESLITGNFDICNEYDIRGYYGFKDNICLLDHGSLSQLNCKNNIILSYVNITNNLPMCDNITSYSLGAFSVNEEDCFDLIEDLENKPKECEKLIKYNDACYTYVARKKNDSSDCGLIASCYSEMAIFQNNLSLCLDKNFVINSDACIKKLAIINKDTYLCSYFEEDWEISACIFDIATEYKDFLLCSEIPDAKWKDNCLSYRVPATENIQLCSYILDCTKREQCKLETKWGRNLDRYEEDRVERQCI